MNLPKEVSMGQKSKAELAVVPIQGTGRPPPPPDLDAIEAHIWRAVVDASPPYTIDAAAQLILKRLAAQAALSEQREARLRQLRQERPDEDEELLALAAAHANGAKMVMTLLTSLRATPRSKTRLRAADARAAKVPTDRPWEDGAA
jgi:hypothetical protein